jgi:type II secretory pathway pseudopilin PulG
MNRYRDNLSFTLVEMLTVVAIIAVLIGLLFPAYNYAKNQAKKAVARQDMSNLKAALLSYRSEYGYFPQTTSWTEMGTMLNANLHPATSVAAASGSFASNNNPRAIRFMEFKTNSFNTAGAFVDPWGTPYILLSDHGGTSLGYATWIDRSQNNNASAGPEDGMLNHPDFMAVAGSNLHLQVAIFSAGPDRVNQYTVVADPNPEVNGDDIYSWRE